MSLINEQQVVLDLMGADRHEATRTLAERLVASGRCTDLDTFLGDVRKREETMATGLPGGIGIPHARSEAITEPSLVFGRVADGIDWGAKDGPANLVFLIAAPASGRILSGGVDAQALYPPKKFFGAARNIENGGSLTIISSALVETGSKMDEVIFEEFKGTGNMELRLSRELADKRLFPAIDVNASGTRREELITDPQELPIIYRLRRLLGGLEPEQAYQTLVPRLKKTATNRDFMASLIQQSGNATNGN